MWLRICPALLYNCIIIKNLLLNLLDKIPIQILPCLKLRLKIFLFSNWVTQTPLSLVNGSSQSATLLDYGPLLSLVQLVLKEEIALNFPILRIISKSQLLSIMAIQGALS